MSFSIKEILGLEVRPALGCTEPVAVALGAAAAASLCPGKHPDSIQVWVDPNVFKNGLAVHVPGTGGMKGLDLASALGALCGDAGQGMQILTSIDEQCIKQAVSMLQKKAVQVNLLAGHKGLYIQTRLFFAQDVAESVIKDAHDHIQSLRLNGEAMENKIADQKAAAGEKDDILAIEAWLKRQSIEQLYTMLQQLDFEDLEFIEQGVQMNLKLAEHGLKHGSGLGIGKALHQLARENFLQKDMQLAAKILTASAADARMAGVNLPAMSSAGSGNNGLISILPIWAAKDFLDSSKEKILQGIGLSHLITAAIKTHTGKLSAVCSCSIAAGAGAAAGLAYLLGGEVQGISRAINLLIADLSGVICDGAKPGCALKLATASGSAVQAALLASKGTALSPLEGVQGFTPEQTIANLGQISTLGMEQTDRTILELMLAKTAKPQIQDLPK